MLEFLEGVNFEEIIKPNKEWNEDQLGKQVDFYLGEDFAIENYTLAILGTIEDRASISNHGCGKGANEIRKELYELYPHFTMPSTIDLGNIIQGKTIRDSQIALQKIVEYLLENKITTIIIGGGHDLSYGQYMGHQVENETMNVVVIDEKINIKVSDEIDSASFLWHIIQQEKPKLTKCTHIGHQMFYNNPNSIKRLEKHYFDAFRLGKIRKDIIEIEPYLRSADMVSFDMSSIKSAECPANASTSPNGFLGEEVCAIARYSGFSNKVNTFGLYEMNPYFDQNNQGAKQASQIIWYFIEGFTGRRKDFPKEEGCDFTQYIVQLTGASVDIVFWKSNFSGRWWMEIPSTKENEASEFLPCTYRDYLTAQKDELPDRWMKAYSRM